MMKPKILFVVVASTLFMSVAVAVTCNSTKPETGSCGAESDCGAQCTGNTWKFDQVNLATKCVGATANDYCGDSATETVSCACEFTCKALVTNPIPSWCVPDEDVMVPKLDDQGNPLLDGNGNVVTEHHCSETSLKIGPNCQLAG